ncbi:hypothetical protein [Acuticoccus kandeliae]|uniref:hypothetical protein n=1 Tax=Acuticoccus kandeliae TaxID=2073160 RepID=UPI000D3E0506|nr:hypothetical protein [Acuticoccus kandeliae]
MTVRLRAVLLPAALALAWTDGAAAADARCFNSDDGTYACRFEPFGGDGSFTISAPMRPSYTILMAGRGVAEGFANYGERNIPLPGPFFRSAADRACWESDSTGFTICAY